jgi:Tetratricopeptide repeat/PEGA domain
MSYRALGFAVIVSLGLQAGLAGRARADVPPPQPQAALKEAGKHFQRGVALYTETDYRAALVEFRRAYETAPNPAVLYNIGQTYYQLQNYAAALVTLQRYLTESGPAALHRREVEQTLETLQTRVGKVTITTNLAGSDIAIDDEPAGKTPFPEPQLVSIGRRKVTASHPGTPPQTQFVDVAAGDTVQLSFTFTEAIAVPVTPIAPAVVAPDAPSVSGSSNRGTIVGWSATGVLAAGAITTAVLAFRASSRLKDARNSFPVTQAELDSKSSSVKHYAIAADVLTGLAVVTGLVTLKYTLSRSHEVSVALAPTGVSLAGTFR